jgi:hypothetical protein
MKKTAHITLGLLSALLFWSSEAAAQTRYWVDLSLTVKDFSASSGYVWFRNAGDNNVIALKQFISNCDLQIIHANNERANHCNTTIGVRIVGLAYWANGYLVIDQQMGCGMIHDSWENKCAVAATTTTTAAATSTATTSTTAAATTATASTETTVTASQQSATIVVNE